MNEAPTTDLSQRLHLLEMKWKNDPLGLTYPMLLEAFKGDRQWLLEAYFDNPILSPYIKQQMRECLPAWELQQFALNRLMGRAEALVTRLEKVLVEQVFK